MMFRCWAFLIVYISCKAFYVSSDSTTVITPKKASGPPAGLIFIPGADIEPHKYIPLGEAVQNATDYSLWLSTVGGWLVNLVNPLQLPTGISDAKEKLHNSGLPSDAPIFIAAHSLGGVFLDEYIRKHPTVASGIILLGSYVPESVKLSDYPLPVLTMAGDEDGLCRLTRIAVEFQKLEEFSARYPVLLVKGVNHSQIASGSMPKNVLNNDIVADLSFYEAHQRLATFFSAFMAINGRGLNSSVVDKAVNDLFVQHNLTGNITRDYLLAAALDKGSGSNKWGSWLQQLVSGVIGGKAKLAVSGEDVKSAEIIALFTPTISKVDEHTLNITVPYHSDMPINPLDISLDQRAPLQTVTSLVTKTKLEEMLPASDFSAGSKTCMDANKATMTMAQNVLPDEYVARYLKRGKKLEFQPDAHSSSALSWAASSMEWKQEGHSLKVTSPVYISSDKNFMWCKALALSRAIEYIMVDSLKN